MNDTPFKENLSLENGIFWKNDNLESRAAAMVLLNDNVFQNLDGFNIWRKYSEDRFGKKEFSEY